MFHIQTKNTIFVTNYGKESFVGKKTCSNRKYITEIKTY